MELGGERFDPELWFLACDGKEIAGVALNYYDEKAETGWVDHLGVRRPWRRRGIGKALLLHTFGEFHRRGIRRVKLSVDSKSLTDAQHLYEGAGMKTVQQYHIYRKALES
jgi:ribosomal protein S18 acetylase RimI-like enzyme